MSTTKTLDAVDFMMMDVHRPLTGDDINEINPQATVDKTLGAGEDEVSDAESVDSPAARCEQCFGPQPCAEHSNVEPLNIVTTHDVPATTILAMAHNKGLQACVVVGLTKDGEEYFASTDADAAESMYHLQRGIWKLNQIVDRGGKLDGD